MTTSLARLLCCTRSFAIFTALAVTSFQLAAHAQSSVTPSSATQPPATALPASQPPLHFEVSSVRPRQSSDTEPSNRQFLPGGRFVATATPLRTLIRITFGSDDNRMMGIPAWADETYDITASTADHAELQTPEQFQQVLLSLLQDRFQLKFHREQKAGSVYWLVVDKPGKLGPALKPSPADAQPNMSTNANSGRTTMRVTSATMTDIAAGLRKQSGRPVEDHTNLPGKFDFQVEWSNDMSQEATAPSLFTVLKEQLGLKLQSASGNIEMIVIDNLSRPDPN